MAQKLLTAEEAAKMLGISVDDLSAMRERRQVFGIRDGSSWKYKQQDVERAAEEMKSGGSGVGLPNPDDQESDSVLLSEVELGDPGSTSMSGTVIGKPGVMSPIDSDIELFDAEDKRAGSSATSDSDVELVPDLGSGSPIDSDVRLVAKEDSPVAGPGSDIAGTVELELSDLSLDDDDTDLPFDVGSSALADSKVKKATDAVKPDGPGSDLTLDVEDASSSVAFDSGLSLGAEPGGDAPSSSSPSGVDSAIELGGSAFEDDDLVLGSHTGSDISDSGISLASPADSGLSLEQPLELGDEGEGSGTAGELMADDEFLLTPAVEMGEEELDESGSQVIALDTEGDFDDSAATMLGDTGGVGMLEEEAPALDAMAGAAVMAAPTMATMQPVIAREAPYSIFNVISLAACALFLMLTGMFMFDLMRNMWSWNGPYTFNSAMMDSIIGMFEQ
jgi:hypothetical protein